MIIKNINISKKITFFLFLTFFFVGIFTFKDYGITIDEEFQRASGFYWLNYVLNFTPFENLKSIVDKLILKPREFTLPPPETYNQWGTIFDLPMAFLEVILEVKDPKNYYHLRHLFNFLIFFISSIFFFKLLFNRFLNYNVSIIGTLFYVLSPRIYGNSFYNNKDLIFLSLLTIALYFCFKLFNKIKFKNLFFFSFFAAACSASRVLGIFLIMSFFIFYLLSISPKTKKFDALIPLFTCCTLYLFFLILLWPYLWSDPLNNFVSAFKFFSKHYLDIKMLFDGEYIRSHNLPYSYILKWIFITTPILYVLLFVYGYMRVFNRFFRRLVNIENGKIHNDFWLGINEKKDLFMLANLTGILFFLILFKTALYTGWRHVYFLNIFIIYLSTVSFYQIGIYLKRKFKNKFHYHISILFILTVIYKMIVYHPFQSFYFNNYFKNISHEKFEIDYWGLSGKKFLKDLLNAEKNKNNISVGVASYLPLGRSVYLLEKENRKKITIVGQNFKESDYIYTNFISEVGKFKNYKYEIPKNFSLKSEFIIDNIKIYEVYKKKENKN